jgi:hypothetical protein
MAAGCIETTRGNVVLGRILLVVSFFPAAMFVLLRSFLLQAKRRRVDDSPMPSQATFTDEGVAYGNAVQQFFAAWTDVVRVRRTPVYWALHCMRDGKESWIIIPSDAIDGELSSLIDDHTPTAQKS